MTGRRSHERLGRLIAALVVPLWLTGCATSHTHLDWGVRESVAHNVAYRPHSEYAARRGCPCPDEVAVPSPRPAWYKPNSNPAPRDEDATDYSAHFSWPLSGRIISDYGSASSGERNDGINIAAYSGEPIRAAADGTVTYAGDDLKSYGNLALIRHDGNFVTAYAHAERFVVSRGDHVARGQVIGYAGKTGDVRSPQLHFEIRQGVRPVNPRPLLGSQQVASR